MILFFCYIQHSSSSGPGSKYCFALGDDKWLIVMEKIKETQFRYDDKIKCFKSVVRKFTKIA